MKKLNLYTKSFSDIGNIQSKKTVEYNVFEENQTYKINISEIYKDKTVEKALDNAFFNFNEALNISKFLYENSVGISNFEYIVEDIIHNSKKRI